MIYLNVTFDKEATIEDLETFYRIVSATGIADISIDDEHDMANDDYTNKIGHYEFRTTKEKATRAMSLFTALIDYIHCSINNEPSRAFAKWREKKDHRNGDERHAI